MPLLKNGDFGADPWIEIDDEAPLPPRPAIISLKRLQSDDAAALRRSTYPLGVRLSPEDPIEALEDWTNDLDLVALEFPKFTDGRAFSSASILRERYGFRGEIRAVGDVLVDQYQFMRRCGFDAFLIREGRALESWAKAKVDMTLAYQTDNPILDHRPQAQSIFEARRQRRTQDAA